MKKKILYIETAKETGGSVFSLYYLVKLLDRDKFSPIIVLHNRGAYIDKFKELEIPILTLETSKMAISKIISRCRMILAQAEHPKIIKYLAAVCCQIFVTVPATLKLINIIKRNAIDLVHLNDQLRGHKAGIIAAKLTGIPVICHQRMFANLNFIDLAFAKRIEKFICNSYFVQETIKSAGIPEDKTIVVYNGLILDDWKPDSANRKTRMGNNRLTVAIVGRLARRKGHHHFIQAIAKLAQVFSNVKSFVIGGSVNDDPQYEALLRREVMDLGLNNKIIFTGFDTNMPKTLASVDVLVHCSTDPESFGRVIIEGMALGKGVIGTSIGAVPELIEHGISGLLVPPADPDALAEALVGLALNRLFLKKLGIKARERVSSNFNMKRNILQIQSVYEQILK